MLPFGIIFCTVIAAIIQHVDIINARDVLLHKATDDLSILQSNANFDDIDAFTAVQGNGVVVYGDCAIDINKDLKDLAPLITPPDEVSFVITNTAGEITIGNGEWIDMYCEKSFIAPFTNYKKLKVQCLQGSYFLVNGTIYPFSNFVCTSWPSTVARRTNRPCNGGTDLLEVGFQLQNDDFLKTIDICYDEVNKVSRYAYYTMNPGNSVHQSGVSRPNFAQGDFYGNMSVNNIYKQVQQKATINKILGKDVSQYFDGNNVFLARGHLAAKADFVFAAAQKATFLFVNVAPQWQSFNGANWENVESSVRDFVGKNQLNIDCYTGTWGVMTLPDNNGEPKQIYLDFDENGNGLIAVPMLYFRIIIDRDSQRGIVLIGVNNPHATLEEIKRDYVICNDISDNISWVNWKKDNLKRGYSYACSVPDFTSIVHDLPNLAVQGLLGVDGDDLDYKPTFF